MLTNFERATDDLTVDFCPRLPAQGINFWGKLYPFRQRGVGVDESRWWFLDHGTVNLSKIPLAGANANRCIVPFSVRFKPDVSPS